jgi:hypothetical protein
VCFEAYREFVAAGGGYVGDHWGAGAALTTAVPNNYALLTNTLKFFTGAADMGDRVREVDNPITVALPGHPVARDLPTIFIGRGGTEFFGRALPPYDSNLTTAANCLDSHRHAPRLAERVGRCGGRRTG